MTQHSIPDRIQWHEGMLLTPQHFQQESARVDGLLGWQTLAVNPFGWGVRKLIIDEGKLNSGTLRVIQVEAVMPNGMAVTYDSATAEKDHVLELNLAQWNAEMTQKDVDIYLVVGSTRRLNQPGHESMFRGVETAAVQDEVSEALPAEVPRMAVNLGLAAGKAPSSSYISLRLITANKANEIVRRGAFMPAMLAVPSDAPIRIEAETLATHMRNKALFLARQTANPSSRTEDRLAMLEQKARLSSLITNLPLLETVLGCQVVQPYPLYMALCAQLGTLATLRPGAVPLHPPAYDHADCQPQFKAVLASLNELVAQVSQEWKTCIFSVDGEGVFALGLAPAMMRKELVVGLRGQPEGEAVRWMNDALIGSQTVAEKLTHLRIPGAARTHISEAPDLGVRSSAGYTLFSIAVSDAYIVADQNLLIKNSNARLQGERPDEIVLFIRG